MENKEGKIRKNRRLIFFTNTINYNNYNFRKKEYLSNYIVFRNYHKYL